LLLLAVVMLVMCCDATCGGEGMSGDAGWLHEGIVSVIQGMLEGCCSCGVVKQI